MIMFVMWMMMMMMVVVVVVVSRHSNKPQSPPLCGSMKGDRSFHRVRGDGTLTRSRRGHQCLRAAAAARARPAMDEGCGHRRS